MGTESLLNDYLSKSRATAERAERSVIVQRVEAVFDELKLPWRRAEDGWEIDSDVGPVRAGLDEDEEVLTFHQIINELTGPPKKQGELLFSLLAANASTTGACFAIFEGEALPKALLAIVGRIAAQKLDSEEVALTLRSVFDLSSLFEG